MTHFLPCILSTRGPCTPIFLSCQELHVSLSCCYCCLVTQSCLFCDPMEYKAARLLCPWGSPDKDTGVGCHALLHLLHWQADSLPLSHQRSPVNLRKNAELEGFLLLQGPTCKPVCVIFLGRVSLDFSEFSKGEVTSGLPWWSSG